MPASPFAASQPCVRPKKLFGGQIVQDPAGPGTNLQYAWIFQNFATEWPNWIKPQIDNWKRRGAQVIACIMGMDGVIDGTYNQAYWEACATTILNYCRAQGLLFHFDAMETGGYSNLSGWPLTAAQIFVPMQSMLTNVLIPNQDLITSLEAGMGESPDFSSADATMSLNIATLAKAATSIPILISTGSLGNMHLIAAGSHDLIGWNVFDFDVSSTHFGACNAAVQSCMQNSGTKPIIVTSHGIRNVSYAAKAVFYGNLYAAAFGHPDVQGMFSWGGQGISPDGDFSLYNIPANPDDPASEWTDTVASRVYAMQGPINRNLMWAMSLTSSTAITNSAADLPWDITVQPEGLQTGAVLNFTGKEVTNLAAAGTISITGDAGSQYTIKFIALDTGSSTPHTIGTPLVITGSAAGQAINMTGTLPSAGDWVFSIQAQRTSGSVNGTATALNVTMQIGNAPPYAPAAMPLFPGPAGLTEAIAIGAGARGARAIMRNEVTTRRRMFRGGE